MVTPDWQYFYGDAIVTRRAVGRHRLHLRLKVILGNSEDVRHDAVQSIDKVMVRAVRRV